MNSVLQNSYEKLFCRLCLPLCPAHSNPALSEGYVRLLYPDKPRHPRQKYLLTVKGLALYREISK